MANTNRGMLGLLLGIVTLSFGCEPIEPPPSPLPPGSSGDACDSHADCLLDLEICLEGRCGLPDADDPDGESCEEASIGMCPDGESCAGGQCVEIDRDCGDVACLEGRVCVDNVCVPDPNGGAGGEGGGGGQGGFGGGGDDLCVEHADCPPGQLCIDNRCTDEGLTPGGSCIDVNDCDPGERCLNGACFPDDQVGLPCTEDSECLQGDRCDASGRCVPALECTSDASCGSLLLECVEGRCLERCPQPFEPPSCGVLENACPPGQVAVCEPGVEPFCWRQEAEILLDERARVEACPAQMQDLSDAMRQVYRSAGGSPLCVRYASPTGPAHCVILGMVDEIPRGAQHPDGIWFGGVTGLACPAQYSMGTGTYAIVEGVDVPRPAENVLNEVERMLREALQQHGITPETYRRDISTNWRPIEWLPVPVEAALEVALMRFRLDIPWLDERDAFNGDPAVLSRKIAGALIWKTVNRDINRFRLWMANLVFSREECGALGSGWPCVNLDNSMLGLVDGEAFAKGEVGNSGEEPDLGGGPDIEVRAINPPRPMPARCFEGAAIPGATVLTERSVTDGERQVCVCSGDIRMPPGLQQGGAQSPPFVGASHCKCTQAPEGALMHGANVVYVGTDGNTTHGVAEGEPRGGTFWGRITRVRSGTVTPINR